MKVPESMYHRIEKSILAGKDEERKRLKKPYSPYDEMKLADLFQRTPELIMVFSAVVDYRIRMQLGGNITPLTIYHFTNLASLEWLAEVMGAVSGADASAQPIELLDFHGQADIDLWRSRYEQMPVLRVEDSDGMTHCLEMLHAKRQQLKRVLFLASDTSYDPMKVIHVLLPSNPHALSMAEKNLLRAAIMHCINQEFHIEVYDAWYNKETSDATPMIGWWATLLELALDKTFRTERGWSKLNAAIEVLKYIV